MVDDGAMRISVTVSIGGAVYRDSAKSPDDFVAVADSALYEAKEGGRNRLVFA